MTTALLVWGERDTAHLRGGSLPDGLGCPKLEAEIAPLTARARRGEAFTVTRVLGDREYELSFVPLASDGAPPCGAACIMTDVTHRRLAEARLEQRVRFQGLAGDLSAMVMQTATDRLEEAIDRLLERVGTFASLDRVMLSRFRRHGTAVHVAHEWHAQGFEPVASDLADLSVEELAWGFARLRRHQAIAIADARALPDEAAPERAVIESIGMRAVLSLPLCQGRSVVGLLNFAMAGDPRPWSDCDLALARLAGELLVNVFERQRAAELEAQLAHARSTETVARLAGGVAHDFNNLVTVILYHAAELRRQLSEPSLVESASAVYDSAKSAAELTRQLLEVGRRGVTRPVVLDVAHVVTAMESLLRGMVGGRSTLTLDLADDPPLVRIGLPQLQQVIVNLVVNARDAMPDGGAVTISVGGRRLDEEEARRSIDVAPGPYAVLSITDTGVGMPSEVVERAFEPFFTTKGPSGTGLGLSTSLGIVKQAGGHVTLDTAPSRGTTVCVYLPAIESAASDGEPASAHPEPVRGGRGELVLVVEDSRALRTIVRTMLTENGYRVVTAGSGEDALRICAEPGTNIDLLLTDVILPGISGRELAERSMELCAVRRCLYMSGYDADLIARQGIVSEDKQLLQKPFLVPDLLRAVWRALHDPV